jgi:hypothetical protein
MSYLRKSFVFVTFLAVSLSACSSTQDIHFAASGIGTNVYSDDSAEQYRMNKTYFGHLCAMAEIPHSMGPENGPYCLYNEFGVSDWNTMVQAGINDIDLRCDAYLSWLDNRKRSEAPLLKQLSDTATRTQAILRFAGSTNLAIDVVAQAFGYAADSVINYNSRLLFEIDTSTVQALVLGRQNEFREGLTQIAFNNKPAMEHALRSYLRICLPFNIETEVNNVITVYQRTGGEPVTPLISAESAGASVRAVRPFRAADPVTIIREEKVRRKPPEPGPRTSKLFINPQLFSNKDVNDAQAALCIAPGSDVGDETLTGVRIFESLLEGSPTVKVDGKITDNTELQALVHLKPGQPICDRTQHRNVYEHLKLDKAAMPGLIKLLNKELADMPPLDEKSQLTEAVRERIALINQRAGVKVPSDKAIKQFFPGTAAALKFH